MRCTERVIKFKAGAVHNRTPRPGAGLTGWKNPVWQWKALYGCKKATEKQKGRKGTREGEGAHRASRRWTSSKVEVKIFCQNATFVAETHVYVKPLTPNRRLLPSNARSVSEKVSKLTKEAGLSFIM